MRQEASFYNDMSVQIKSVRDDSEQQIKDIEDFIKEKVDLLIISPNEATSLTPIVEKVYKAGIPVILYDRKVNSDQYTAFVGGDNHQIGNFAGSYALSILHKGGNIVIIHGTQGSTADTDRYNGFMDAIEGSNVKVVAETYANFNQTESKKAMLKLLGKSDSNKPYNLIFALNDEMAAGVYDAYDSVGIKERPYIIGIDALLSTDGHGTISYIVDGMIDASFIYPTGGDVVIDLARNILTKGKYHKENILNTELVNKNNVKVYQMQLSQIKEKQNKVQELNSRIMASNDKYERQQLLTYVLFALAIILGIMFIILAISASVRNKLVQQLNQQNSRIQNQVNSLEEQKEQLMNLSHQLEETTQAKLVFFTNISHEFKTPLSLISGPIDDLIANKDMPQNAMALLDILKRNSSKLTRLITELLDFRTFESGKMVVNYSMGNLDNFLNEIVKMFSDVVKRRNLHFSYEVDDADYMLPFDPIKFEKVFTNLLSNAFNHVDKEGTIRIRLFSNFTNAGREVNLSVFNSGSYIPPENINKIFQRFYTLDVQQKGTGIGLALVSSILDSLGGTIKVESDESKGTEFSVTIPIKTDLHTDAKIDGKTYVPEFAKLKFATMGEEDVDSGIVDEMSYKKDGRHIVLVIEDNLDMRLYIKNILSTDYQVFLAKDGNLGLAKAVKIMPDIIISDIMMPDIDGYQVCTSIRQNNQLKNIPIILLTACSFEEQKAQGYESGADAFMQKPFNVNTLKVRMKTLLEKSEKVSSEINGGWLIGKDTSSLPSESIDMLNKFRSYVEKNILDTISLDDLAQNLGYSKSKLYRELKDVTDYSPVDLVNLVRLRKAVDLMVIEHQNITEASFNTGFSSPSYFSRTFLKYYHVRPKDYILNK
jgi:signal transduction histidine kinase/DNA-binding response OmpR family regulator